MYIRENLGEMSSTSLKISGKIRTIFPEIIVTTLREELQKLKF